MLSDPDNQHGDRKWRWMRSHRASANGRVQRGFNEWGRLGGDKAGIIAWVGSQDCGNNGASGNWSNTALPEQEHQKALALTTVPRADKRAGIDENLARHDTSSGRNSAAHAGSRQIGYTRCEAGSRRSPRPLADDVGSLGL